MYLAFRISVGFLLLLAYLYIRYFLGEVEPLYTIIESPPSEALGANPIRKIARVTYLYINSRCRFLERFLGTTEKNVGIIHILQ